MFVNSNRLNNYFKFIVSTALYFSLNIPVIFASSNILDAEIYRRTNYQVIDKNEDGIRIRFEFNNFVWESDDNAEGETGRFLSIGNGSFYESPGNPVVPFAGYLFRMSNAVDVEYTIEDSQVRLEYAPDYKHVGSGGTELDEEIPDNSWFPHDPVKISEPAHFHDFQVASLQLFPVQVNRNTGEVRIIESLELDLQFSGSNNTDGLPGYPGRISRSFLPLYQTFLDWDENELDDYELYHGNVQVIVRNDEILLDQFEPWFEWKRQKGWNLTLLTEDDVPAWTRSNIRNELISRYEEADPKFDYVVVIGDATGPFSVPSGSIGMLGNYGAGDFGYSTLNGNDQLPDVHIGRISVETIQQAASYVNKVLNYEKNPDPENNGWYNRGMVAAGSEDSGITTIYQGRYTRELMLENGYTQVDTAWYNDGLGDVRDRCITAINNGVNTYLYRGLVGLGMQVQDIYTLENDGMLPVVYDITCNTGDWADGLGINEAWMRGSETPNQSRGGIGAIGTATANTLTRYNNALVGGAVFSQFVLETPALGDLLTAGKLNMWANFHGYEDATLDSFMVWANLMGDPLLWYWPNEPAELDVEYPGQLDVGEWNCVVDVSQFGDPVDGAWVTITRTDENYDTVYHKLTDQDGEAEFFLEFMDPGEAMLTVTKPGYAPCQEIIDIIQPEERLSIAGIEIDDVENDVIIGNGNGVIEAGETVALRFSMANSGQNLQENVIVNINSDHPWIDIVDSAGEYGTVNPGETVFIEDEIIVRIFPEAQDQSLIRLFVEIVGSLDIYTDHVPLNISAPDFGLQQILVTGDLDPGETATVEFSLENIGGSISTQATVTLTTEDIFLDITQNEAEIPGTEIGGISTTGEFSLLCDPNTYPGHQASLTAIITTESGQVDTIRNILITLGNRDESDPVGPDGYGYYAFDNIDSDYIEAPAFEWIEINPDEVNHLFAGTRLALEDTSEEADDALVMDLPFTVKYYGENFEEITITPNGYVAMGRQDHLPTYRNWTIPSPLGPNYMIAPYWDDRRTAAGGGVYTYYDEINGRFIIEWYQLTDFYNQNPCTFELIIYDQVEGHETVTNDNELLFQYLEMNHSIGHSEGNQYWTTGIENGNQTDGIMISYWNDPQPGAAEIADGRSILFTTHTYDNIIDISDSGIALPTKVNLYSPYPNPFNNSTLIRFDLPGRSGVKFSVYNMLGQVVENISRQFYQPGHHSFYLDGTGWSSGIYFVRMSLGNGDVFNRKLVYLK